MKFPSSFENFLAMDLVRCYSLWQIRQRFMRFVIGRMNRCAETYDAENGPLRAAGKRTKAPSICRREGMREFPGICRYPVKCTLSKA